jgi:hypothetical protein
MASSIPYSKIRDSFVMIQFSHHPLPNAAAAVSILAATFVSLAGCGGGQTTTQTTMRQSPAFSTPAERAERARAARDRQVGANDFGQSVVSDAVPQRVTNTVIRAEIQLQGNVPYDNMSMPLVSPDGRFIATQTRVSPTWPTLLAEWDADVPVATRIEIYRRPTDGRMVELHATIHEPLILGRSYDQNGFLVEAPQDDGSRWIGYVQWDSAELHWLVADDFVNAFPSLGPDGRLAWSRRGVNDADHHFELVIRSPNGDDWSYPHDRESWLMPTWSGRGNGMFVFVLTDDYLEAAYAVASDASAFRQSQQRIGLARSASVHSAYQAVGAQISSPSVPWINANEQLVFFHPSRMRMAVWRPMSGRQNPVMLLNRNSFAAVVDSHDRAFVTTEDHLLIQQVTQPTDRAELLAGTLIARPVNIVNWPYVLLAPANGEVAVAALRPFVPEDADVAKR